MSKSDTMLIAFPHGGTLPASLGGGKERKAGPHEAVKVPLAYGTSLVDDGFAYETDPARAKAASEARAGGLPDREAVLRKAEAALAEREAAVAKAEADVAARETAVESAEVELAGREAAVGQAEAELAEREAALAKGDSGFFGQQDAANEDGDNGSQG